MPRPLLAAFVVFFAAPGAQGQRPDFLEPLLPPLKPQRRFGPDGWENPPGRAPVAAPADTPLDTPLGTPPGFFTGVFRLVAVPCFLVLMALLAAAFAALSRGQRKVRRRRRRADYDDPPPRRAVRPRLTPPGPPALARAVEGPPRRATPKLLPPADAPPAKPPDLPFV